MIYTLSGYMVIVKKLTNDEIKEIIADADKIDAIRAEFKIYEKTVREVCSKCAFVELSNCRKCKSPNPLTRRIMDGDHTKMEESLEPSCPCGQPDCDNCGEDCDERES
jgi:hypothetical protein